nr:immunoglobulin heavy chain junction region [Mus musculus]
CARGDYYGSLYW